MNDGSKGSNAMIVAFGNNSKYLRVVSPRFAPASNITGLLVVIKFLCLIQAFLDVLEFLNYSINPMPCISTPNLNKNLLIVFLLILIMSYFLYFKTQLLTQFE